MILISKEKREKNVVIEPQCLDYNTIKKAHCFFLVCKEEPLEVQAGAKDLFERCVNLRPDKYHWLMLEKDNQYLFNEGEEIVEKTVDSVAFIKNPDYGFKIISMIMKYIIGKKKPKDVCMPIRAAMDANVIRRPTYEEFIASFGNKCPKSSFSEYTSLSYTFDGDYYESMVDDFKRIITE